MKRLIVVLIACNPVFALAQQPMSQKERMAEIQELRADLARISVRLDELERATEQPGESVSANPAPVVAPTPAPVALATGINKTAEDRATLSFFEGTTLNFGLDGYYSYNFNAPIGRVNLLRAYDVSSNSFSINQASVVVEHLPTPQERVGGRIDLQFGQATETLQGSYANEQRPQVWRNLYQAYGSYLAPVGSGLQLDFGKFASALGNEGNYTKDQVAYSRSFSFFYLPFYHMGLRASYNLSPKVNFTYWLVNGANDTEDLNGFKSQGFIFTLKPASTVSWNVNYYFGEEARDVQPTPYPGAPTAPTQPGLPTTNINPAPNGREHIFNTYATWTPTAKLTFSPEADFVINRNYAEEAPSHTALGLLTVKYSFGKNWYTGARFEYFDDRSGLFSGKSQAIKEGTLVLNRFFSRSFMARAEYRRDFSNQPFFLTDTAGYLVHAQTTATIGLIYWWGTKQGSW